MRVCTLIPPRALLTLANPLAQGLTIVIAISFSIFAIVVIGAMLMLVLFRVGAGMELEVVDVQVLWIYQKGGYFYVLGTG